MSERRRGPRGISVRPLAWLLLVQVLLGGVLLGWALAGFPLPSVLRGGETISSATAESRSSTPADGSTSGSAMTATAPAATSDSGVPRPTRDDFDETRAFALVREQVRQFGPRPAGSSASRRLARRLRRLLPNGRFEGIPGHRRLRNVVGHLPGRRPAIVLGAHYDTEAVIAGHVGANDGAAGTAAVVEIARALRGMSAQGTRRPREIRFVLFDGEEEPPGSTDFLADGLRGSRAYVKRHASKVQTMVLLDYIAERAAPRYPRESGSDAALWAQLRAAAVEVGVGALFPDEDAGVQILDDHTPFSEAGIAAIDVIDFDYPQRDSLADNLDAVSAESLDATGEAALALLRRVRR